MIMKNLLAYWVSLCLLFSSCNGGGSLPKEYGEASEVLQIYPDYQEVEMPYNIAPINFMVNNQGKEARLLIKGETEDQIVVSSGEDMKLCIPQSKWRKMLDSNKGKSVVFTVFVKSNDGKWLRYKPFANFVSTEAIDKYVTYRLIEPSYMSTGEIGIYQYDTETAGQTAIITNHRKKKIPENRDQCCINCHSSQRGNPENKLFYYRGPTGGLILTYNGKIKKIDTRAGDMFSGTVYASWHPSLPLIAFSSNVVRQSFYNRGKEKVHIYDFASDLVLYDINGNEITAICKTKDKQETFPYWNSDGTILYFCSSDSIMDRPEDIVKMKYDLKRMKFNAEDKTWSEPEMIYCASKENLSAIHPRTSYSDKYLIFTKTKFGPNGYTQKASDLYIMDTKTNAVRSLDEVNTPESECYHAWCAKSDWFLYVGRVDDGNYGRVYFSHVDSFGHVSKPLPMPHEDPLYDHQLLKSYNAPEFSVVPVSFSQKEYEDVIFNGEILKAKYGSPITDSVDSYSGASKLGLK